MSPAGTTGRNDDVSRQALRDLSHAAGTGGVDDDRMTATPSGKAPSPVKVLVGFLIVVAAITAFAVWAQGKLG